MIYKLQKDNNELIELEETTFQKREYLNLPILKNGLERTRKYYVMLMKLF